MAYNTGSSPTLAQHITGTFVPEMYSRDILMHTKSNLVCANLFNRQFQSQLERGSVVNIPVLSEITATEVTPNTEASASNLVGTPTTITIDKWQYAAVEISPLMKIEQLADYMKAGAESCGYALSKAIDTDIGGLFSTLASTSSYGSDGQTFTDDIFIALVEVLDELDIPAQPRFLIGDPSMRADMLKIDKFVRTDYVRETVPSGQIGRLYDATVHVTNNLTAATTGNYGVYSHRDAIGVVIQKDMNSKYWDLGYKFINKIIVDVAWGADEIRDTFGKSFYTRKS